MFWQIDTDIVGGRETGLCTRAHVHMCVCVCVSVGACAPVEEGRH